MGGECGTNGRKVNACRIGGKTLRKTPFGRRPRRIQVDTNINLK
jgi:hypothetical protein